MGVSGGSGKGKGQQYNIADDEEKKEHFDDEIALNKKVKKKLPNGSETPNIP